MRRLSTLALWLCLSSAPALAQTPVRPQPAPAAPAQTPAAAPAIPTGVTPPADYVIGTDDQLVIIFWREKDMSAEVSVRPDGKISLPLLNDIQAAGLTPEQLRLALTEAAGKYIEEPTVTVVVKAINSRRVFITGQVAKPGPYLLTSPTTVLQALASADALITRALWGNKHSKLGGAKLKRFWLANHVCEEQAQQSRDARVGHLRQRHPERLADKTERPDDRANDSAAGHCGEVGARDNKPLFQGLQGYRPEQERQNPSG